MGLCHSERIERSTAPRIFKVIKARSSLEVGSGGKVSSEAIVAYAKEQRTLPAQSGLAANALLELRIHHAHVHAEELGAIAVVAHALIVP